MSPNSSMPHWLTISNSADSKNPRPGDDAQPRLASSASTGHISLCDAASAVAPPRLDRIHSVWFVLVLMPGLRSETQVRSSPSVKQPGRRAAFAPRTSSCEPRSWDAQVGLACSQVAARSVRACSPAARLFERRGCGPFARGPFIVGGRQIQGEAPCARLHLPARTCDLDGPAGAFTPGLKRWKGAAC